LASLSGSSPLATSPLDNAHAWQVGYTANLAMAVWVGNRETEFPLRDKVGNRISGATVPADIFREVMAGAHAALGLPTAAFAQPAFVGSAAAGDAR
jgi:membrane peptidoglycan carboxypeptidase